MSYAIYLDHEYGSSIDTTTVLLTDGCWTEQDSCNQRCIYNHERDADGVVMHRPKLFAAAGGALNHLKTKIGVRPCYRVAKYTGPTDPNARPAIDYTVCAS